MGEGYERARSADLYASRNLERMEASGRARERIVAEASDVQRAATGARPWGIDADLAGGFRLLGGGGAREVPERTREQARADSVAAYRSNPLGRAVIDTYVAFCVGDSGLTVQCPDPEVRRWIDAFWLDPRNDMPGGQELMLREKLLNGEGVEEMMVDPFTGVCRRSPIDGSRVVGVELLNGNSLWHDRLHVRMGPGSAIGLQVIGLDDISGLRHGEVFFWPMFRALQSDRRGFPLLAPVLDWLDAFDQLLGNLIDRTVVARYVALQYKFKGRDQTWVDNWVAQRGGNQLPRSGTIEATTDDVEISPINAPLGSYEDVNTVQAIMTMIAGGVGLAKHWLGEPDQANRATSLTMAEPVRRRIKSVANAHVAHVTEMLRYVVDQGVAAGRVPRFVSMEGAGGELLSVPAADTVQVTGPQIAAADAQINATVLQLLAQALDTAVSKGLLTIEASRLLIQKAWEDSSGRPFPAELAATAATAEVDALATELDRAAAPSPLA